MHIIVIDIIIYIIMHIIMIIKINYIIMHIGIGSQHASMIARC